MRILLVSPSPLNTGEWSVPHFDMRKRCIPPLGISILGEVIKQNHEVEMLFYDHTTNNIKQILKEAARSDILGFNIAHFIQYPATREIIRNLKQEEINAKIVVGGPFPTYHSQYLCEDGVDIVMNGEGEIAFPHLLEALENGENLSRVQGISYRENSSIYTTGAAPFPDLDQIPLPCYDVLPLSEANYKNISCETSRGCPNHCSFCAIYPHETWRGHSPEKAIIAMEHAMKYLRYSKVPCIFCVDSNFAGSFDRVKEIADLIDDEIPLYTATRLDDVNRNTVKYLKRIGFKAVCTGVESGSKSTLTSVNKNISVGLIEKKLQLLIDHGIIPRTSFIFGLPGEDKDSVISTMKQIRHMVELFGENIHILVFPFRQDISETPVEFDRYKSFETVADALIPMHDQEFRLWALALEYLVNVYHDTLQPEEQIAMFDTLIRSPPKAVIELAETYDGEAPSWLLGLQRFFHMKRGRGE
ncbi:MAG: B12-binding domain-containing radical SAM protein [Theionarchaea archaeon]|nr:B12-binding domain-containing radical SAM protein [Theionarchaea archaeon]